MRGIDRPLSRRRIGVQSISISISISISASTVGGPDSPPTRGVIVIGQLGIGVVTVGQLPLGVVWSAGMVGVGGTSPGWLVLSLLPRRKAVADSPYAILAGGHVRASTGRLLLGVAGVLVLALVWWLTAGQDVLDALFGPGGVLNSERQLR